MGQLCPQEWPETGKKRQGVQREAKESEKVQRSLPLSNCPQFPMYILPIALTGLK